METIWDSYSFNVLSKQHFLLNDIDFIVVENISTKIDYNESTKSPDQAKYSSSKESFEFEDFHYKSKYIVESSKPWKQIETFIDKKTKHVRQNERDLFIDTIENILFLAEKNRFKKIDLYSEHEYYVLKKI